MVGKALTERFSEDKFEVVKLDCKASENGYKVDVTDLSGLRGVFRKMGKIASVVHLAGDARMEAPWENVLRVNIGGTKHVYECAKEFGVPQVILASSTHLFGLYPQYPNKPSEKPIPVNAPYRSDSDYGTGKGFGEILARQYYDNAGIRSIVLRIGSLVEDDKQHEPYERIYLSKADAASIFESAIRSNIGFGTYFAISDVNNGIFDMEPTVRDLGFVPQGSK
jgi:nucleoside-diphosphate-sugar epimerase